MDKQNTYDKIVNIMGVDWTLKIVADDPAFDKAQGYTNYASREIIVEAIKEPSNPLDFDLKAQYINQKRVIRHEVVHAYLFECGLADDSASVSEGWAINEEMIDWFARISPRIFDTYKELKIL